MSASIIQLLSKDKRDSFLTYKPDITFFKDNVKQHSPFAIDIHEEEFNRTPNFSDEVFCELSKLGDLVKSLMIKIVIPKVQISNSIDIDYLPNYSQKIVKFDSYELTVDDLILEYNTKISNIMKFMSSAMIYWRSIKLLLNNSNVNYNSIISHINDLINTQNDVQNTYDRYNTFTNTKIMNTLVNFNFDILTHLRYNYSNYGNSVYNATLTIEYKEKVLKYLDDFIFFKKKYLSYLYQMRDKYIMIKAKHDSSYYKFAWVNNIALKIIESVTLEIGGQQIDYHGSLSLDKWFDMATKIDHVDTLNTLFGNTQILTSFDSNEKPQYELYIPLPFGCLLHSGQSIPVVSTRYQDIIVRMKLADLHECCFFEPDEFPTYTSNININEEIQIVSASLLVEYVHLSDKERKKFATKNIEMLFEQHCVLNFSSLKRKNMLLPLDFNNAVKDIFWSVRKKYNVEQMKLWNNYDVFNAFPARISTVGDQAPFFGCIVVNLLYENYFDNAVYNYGDYEGGMCEIFHSNYYNGKYKILKSFDKTFVINSKEFIYPDNIKIILHRKDKQMGNIVEKENIKIYGDNMISLRDTVYFKYVQDRYRSKTSNCCSYSFALKPEDLQPSGVLNFNVAKNKQLQLTLTDTAINQLQNDDSYIAHIIGKNYNTLNIAKGYARIMYS